MDGSTERVVDCSPLGVVERTPLLINGAGEFEELVTAHGPAVYAVAFCVTGSGSLSEDVAQEAFLCAWQQRASLRDATRFRQWVCGIARNIARNENRRRSRAMLKTQPLDAEEERAQPSPLENVIDREVRELVWSALAQIPPRYREVMALYYREGCSAKEVAGALGISESLVMQRLHRGRRYLKAEVKELVEQGLAKLAPSVGFSATVLAAIPLLSTETAAAKTAVVSLFSKEASIMLTTKHAAIALATAAIVAAGVTFQIVRDKSASEPGDVSAGKTAPAAAIASHSKSTAPSLDSPLPEGKRGNSVANRPSPLTAPEAGKGATPHAHAHSEDSERPPFEIVDPELIADLDVKAGHARGPDDAPVTIAVFTDFSCKYCAMVLGTLDELREEYPESVRVVKKLFPLKETSRRLAQATAAASEEGKFWEMHDVIFASQNEEALTDDQLVALAKQIGLDTSQFRENLNSETIDAIVQHDIDEGMALGVKGTPTLFVNNKRVIGTQALDLFRSLIDDELEMEASTGENE